MTTVNRLKNSAAGPSCEKVGIEHNGASDGGNYATRFSAKCNVYHRFKADVTVLSRRGCCVTLGYNRRPFSSLRP
jgi:hypothetical protein